MPVKGYPPLFDAHLSLFIEILPILKQPWIDDAACSEVDPSLWFPEQGREDDSAKAKKICRACAVVEDCSAWVSAHEERGIWAGRSAAERRREVAA